MTPTSTATLMGSLSTKTGAFVTGGASPGAGQLRIVVRTGRAGLGFAGLPVSNSGRFPGAIIAIRRANTAIPRANDVRYIALPASFISTSMRSSGSLPTMAQPIQPRISRRRRSNDRVLEMSILPEV